jgi:hypothetical protein
MIPLAYLKFNPAIDACGAQRPITKPSDGSMTMPLAGSMYMTLKLSCTPMLSLKASMPPTAPVTKPWPIFFQASMFVSGALSS